MTRRWAPALALVLGGGSLLAAATILAPISMNPGDTLAVHCPTTMSGTITAQDANLACAATPTPTPTPVPTPSPSPTPAPTSLTLPVRAAFYYPWFPEAWNQLGFNPFTRYHPGLGFYDSSDPTVIQTHVSEMLAAGLQAGIASWWGQGTPTDGRIPALLANAGNTFRWTLYYEPEGSGNPTVTQIDSDLTYIAAHYASDPAYLRVAGKPVLFVYGGTETCEMTTRWATANANRFYLVLKVFAGYRTCANQPNGWHQYAPAVATDHQAGFSYSISPGFWRIEQPPGFGGARMFLFDPTQDVWVPITMVPGAWQIGEARDDSLPPVTPPKIWTPS